MCLLQAQVAYIQNKCVLIQKKGTGNQYMPVKTTTYIVMTVALRPAYHTMLHQYFTVSG